MSNTATFAYLIMFIFTFIGLLTLFGITQPGFQQAIQTPSQCLINDNPPEKCSFPSWNPPIPANITTTQNQVPWYQCIISTVCIVRSVTGVIGGSTGQAIWNGMSEIAYGLSLIPQSIFVFFNKLGSLIFLLNGINQFLNSDLGVPFVGYIFFGFAILLVVFGGAMLKPGGHGQ
jgi:hypothetical protein